MRCLTKSQLIRGSSTKIGKKKKRKVNRPIEGSEFVRVLKDSRNHGWNYKHIISNRKEKSRMGRVQAKHSLSLDDTSN